MKVLVLGCKGYVGSNLLLGLIDLKVESFGLFRCPNRPNTFCVTQATTGSLVWEGSIIGLKDFLIESKISVVINVAGAVDKECTQVTLNRLIDDNIRFTAATALAAAEAGVRKYVFASTYSSSIDGITYSPQTLYSATKRATEDLLVFISQSKSMKIEIPYIYDIYGPKQPHERLVPVLVNGLLQKLPIKLSEGAQEINLVHIHDLVDALIHLALKIHNPGEKMISFRTICGLETFKVRDLTNIISQTLEIDWTPGQLSFNLPHRVNEIWSFKPIHPQIEGWVPKIDFRTGIRTLIE